MANDERKRMLTLVGVLLLGGLLGILTWQTLLAPASAPAPMDEDERPPIIVQNGSIELEGPHETTPQGAGWEKVGNSGKWTYKRGIKKPQDAKNLVFGGACSGDGWKTGDLKIIYDVTTDDGTGGSTTVTQELTIEVNGVNVVVDPGGQQGVAQTAELLTFHKVQGTTTRIVSVETTTQGASGKCTFNAGSKPVIFIQ